MHLLKDPVFLVVTAILTVCGVLGVVSGGDGEVDLFNILSATTIKSDYVFSESIFLSRDEVDTVISVSSTGISFLYKDELKFALMLLQGDTLVLMDKDGNILQTWK